MTNRAGGPGRTSKGARIAFATRLPTNLAEHVRETARQQDLSFSDYIANVLAREFGLPAITDPAVRQEKLTA